MFVIITWIAFLVLLVAKFTMFQLSWWVVFSPLIFALAFILIICTLATCLDA